MASNVRRPRGLMLTLISYDAIRASRCSANIRLCSKQLNLYLDYTTALQTAETLEGFATLVAPPFSRLVTTCEPFDLASK